MAWFFVVEVIERGCVTGLPLGYIFCSFIEFTKRRQWEGGDRKKILRKESCFFGGWGVGGLWSEDGRFWMAHGLDFKLLTVNRLIHFLRGMCNQLYELWQDDLGRLNGGFPWKLGGGFEGRFGWFNPIGGEEEKGTHRTSNA